MPDILDENGLQVKTLTELIEEKEKAYRDIFGSDVILDSNSPDGQVINIDAQAGIDIRERIVDVYNSFDPDKCIGRLQDSRYKINGIARNGGTYTVQPIDIVVNKTVTLEGLDDNYNDANATAFGVKDSAGNVWYLIDTTTITNTSTYTRLSFRSQAIGLVQPTIGEINEQVTPISGVVSVINSVAPTSIGIEQETDEEFQIRRNKSTSVMGQGNIDTIQGQLLQLEGVNDAKVYTYDFEYYPNADANGVNPHHIWAIVEGGSNEDIAEVLYTHCGGAGMKGSVNIDVFTANGHTFKTHFDRPTAVPLYIQFNLQETVPDTIFDKEAIKEYIANNLVYSIGQLANSSEPTSVATTALNTYSASGTITNLQISTNGSTWVYYIPAPNAQSQFVVDKTRITINEINI